MDFTSCIPILSISLSLPVCPLSVLATSPLKVRWNLKEKKILKDKNKDKLIKNKITKQQQKNLGV